jgi:hypothetical protein
MNAKIFIPILLILSVCSLKAQDASAQCFQQAFEEISAMLEGKQPLDFERAVFITENAYRENSFQYEDFKTALDVHSSIIEQFIKANDKYDWKQFVRGNMGIAPDMEVEAKERYRKALANYAIFTYLTDTLTVRLDGQESLHLPYTYSNDDPFGTADWKNSQTINLLETQKGNCYSLVTLFKIFSERFKSEANIGTAPQHIYIEHRDPKGSRFNVEVATRSFPDFGSIQTLTYTTGEAIRNDISMRKLDLKQSIGLCLVYLAKGYEYKNKIKDDEFILTCANTALQHDPKNLNALLLKAQVYEQRVMKKQMPSEPYEKMLADLYKLGYRQMPDDMKEIILSKIQGRPSTVTPTNKTPNTFEGIGEQARVGTLSHGLFEELHKPQKIVRYGQTIFDTEKSKIVKFLDEDISSYQVDPVVFALSVDPLSYKYAELTPYQFASNRPIDGIDLDGLEYVGTTEIEDGTPVLVPQSAFAINDFLANTFSLGMHIVSKSAEGRAIRKVLEQNGYDVSYLSNEELGEGFNIKMITGGSVENPQRGWTVLPTGSALSETADYALGGLTAFAVGSSFKAGAGNDPAALLGKGGGIGFKNIQNILRGLYISKRADELKALGVDAATKRAFSSIELADAANLEFSVGGKVAPSSHPAYDWIGTGGNLLGEKISHMGIPASATGKYKINDILSQIDKHLSNGKRNGVTLFDFNFSNLSSADKGAAVSRTVDQAGKLGIDLNKVYIKQ